MKRTTVIASVVALIALPALWAIFHAVSFYARNRNNGSIVSSDRKREYLLYVPRSYDASKPAPLVISLHGGAGWPVLQKELSKWNEIADAEGFIVVYPAGTGVRGAKSWGVEPGGRLTRDVRFISDLIDTVSVRYNIDPARIYVNGLSNGGGMSFVLSCALSHRIAAVGLVAPALTVPASWCTDHRPVPMIAFHGTGDPLIPVEGGDSIAVRTRLPSISRFVETWARRNRCASVKDQFIAPDVTRREYRDCAGGAPVVYYAIRGGGHTWPGGPDLPEWFLGKTNRTVDATREMWTFFRAHPRTSPTTVRTASPTG